MAKITFISEWFKDKELACAMGMSICLGRAGTVLNYLISPPIYIAYDSLALSFWVGALIMGISLIFATSAAFLDQDTEGYNEEKVPIKCIFL